MPIDVELLRAYSRGELSRRDIEDRVGAPVSFGTLLVALGAHDLHLPRFPVDAAKADLIRRLVVQGDERAR